MYLGSTLLKTALSGRIRVDWYVAPQAVCGLLVNTVGERHVKHLHETLVHFSVPHCVQQWERTDRTGCTFHARNTTSSPDVVETHITRISAGHR